MPDDRKEIPRTNSDSRTHMPTTSRSRAQNALPGQAEETTCLRLRGGGSCSSNTRTLFSCFCTLFSQHVERGAPPPCAKQRFTNSRKTNGLPHRHRPKTLHFLEKKTFKTPPRCAEFPRRVSADSRHHGPQPQLCPPARPTERTTACFAEAGFSPSCSTIVRPVPRNACAAEGWKPEHAAERVHLLSCSVQARRMPV